MSSNPYEELLQAVRIETTTSNGKHRYGTGFPYHFCDKLLVNKMAVGKHAIVTNKHVIADALEGLLYINKRDLNGQCIFGEKVELKFKRNDWIDHPDENVDLSVLPILPKLYKINLEIKDLFIHSYNQYLPDKKTWKMFSPVEGVVTIGFPNGFWDDYNNIPITRKGITATHPKLDYRFREAFWIDITIYPGMSGSPVFLLDYGIEYYEGGAYSHGAKTYFLGVLSAMAKYRKDKSGIEISSIPTESLDDEVLNVISSLGYVIKASKLKDFDSVLENIY